MLAAALIETMGALAGVLAWEAGELAGVDGTVGTCEGGPEETAVDVPAVVGPGDADEDAIGAVGVVEGAAVDRPAPTAEGAVKDPAARLF